MHTIEPARLKPGVEFDSLPEGTGDPGEGQSNNLISGRALIFWDPMSLPGTRFAKKLDAIDTDQITPAADCVSESLETPRREMEGRFLSPPDARLPRSACTRGRTS